MAKPLVIVESPAKAKTLGRFLGSKYRVEASFGHIRDLPESAASVPKEIKDKEWGRLGVDVDSDFTPYYVVPIEKKKQVAHLKTAVKEASELLLATDPDREGESISWHLKEVLKPQDPGPADRVPRDHRGRRQRSARASVRRQREPGPRPGEPPHPRPALRLHAVAGAVEEGADRPQRRPRAERGRPADRRARRGAARVPLGRVLGPRGDAEGRGPPVRGHAGAAWTTSASRGQGLRRPDRCAQEPERAPARRSGRHHAASTPCGERAVAGDVRRAEARCRAPGAAVHHLDAHAGGQPQARVLHRAHDADGPAAVPGRGHRRRREGPHHLSPHRLDDAVRQGAERVGPASSGRCSAASTTTGRGAIRPG